MPDTSFAVFRCPSCQKPTPQAQGQCRHCGVGFQLAEDGTTTPTQASGRVFDGNPKPLLFGCAGSVLVGLTALGLSVAQCSREADERERVEQAAQTKEEEDRYQASVANGSVCADGWSGSNIEFVDAVKARLRDPDSFEHMRTSIGARTKEGTYPILMAYRARNGFGGYNVGTATGLLTLRARRECHVVAASLGQ